MVKVFKNICYFINGDALSYQSDYLNPELYYGFFLSTMDETSSIYYQIKNQDGDVIKSGDISPQQPFVEISGSSSSFISVPPTQYLPNTDGMTSCDLYLNGNLAYSMQLCCYNIDWSSVNNPDLYTHCDFMARVKNATSSGIGRFKPDDTNMIYEYDLYWNYSDWNIIRGYWSFYGYNIDDTYKLPTPGSYTGSSISSDYDIYINAKENTNNGIDRTITGYTKRDFLGLELLNPTTDGTYAVFPGKYINKTSSNYTITLDKEYYLYGETTATASITSNYIIKYYRDNFNDFNNISDLRSFKATNTTSYSQDLDISKLPWEEITPYTPIIIFYNSDDKKYYANISGVAEYITFNKTDYVADNSFINGNYYYKYKIGNFSFMVGDIQLKDSSGNILTHCLDYYISGDSSSSYLYLKKDFVDNYTTCQTITLEYYKSVNTLNIQFASSDTRIEYEYSDVDSINKYGVRDGGVFFIPVDNQITLSNWCKAFVDKNKYPKKNTTYSSINLAEIDDFPFLGRTINNNVIYDCNITIDNNKIVKCELKTGDYISTFIELFIKKIKDSE